MLLIVNKIMKIKRMYLGYTFLFIYTCRRGKGVCGIKFSSWTIQATKNPVAATARKQKAVGGIPLFTLWSVPLESHFNLTLLTLQLFQCVKSIPAVVAAPAQICKTVLQSVTVTVDLQEMTVVKLWIFVSALLVQETAVVYQLPVVSIACVQAMTTLVVVFVMKVYYVMYKTWWQKTCLIDGKYIGHCLDLGKILRQSTECETLFLTGRGCRQLLFLKSTS